jgi:hypothetical protein
MFHYSARAAGLFAGIFFLASTAMAHGSHCHKKTTDGTLIDFPEAKTKAACVADGGVWLHHHAHCHQANNPHADIVGVHSEKQCLAEGGKWYDHAHKDYAR